MPSDRINSERVTHVLLPDGWHKVGQIFPDFADSALSFDLVPFSIDNGEGETTAPVPGFRFCEAHTGFELHGPLSAIRGVRTQGLSAPEPWHARLWRQATGKLRRPTLRPALSDAKL